MMMQCLRMPGAENYYGVDEQRRVGWVVDKGYSRRFPELNLPLKTLASLSPLLSLGRALGSHMVFVSLCHHRRQGEGCTRFLRTM